MGSLEAVAFRPHTGVAVSVDDIFDAVAAERLAIADQLQSLSAEQLAAPSLCDGWSVHHVAAHLTMPWAVSAPTMAMRVLRARSISRAIDGVTHELAQQPITEIIDSLRANAHNRKHPPGLPRAPLTDLLVHGEDVRRPLGLHRAIPMSTSRLALQFVTSGRDRGTYVPTSRLGGLRLVATDQDWAWGEGAQISGRSMSLLLAAMGRRVALPELNGAANLLEARL